MKSSISILLLSAAVALAEPPEAIQRATLDENIVVTVPVATNRVGDGGPKQKFQQNLKAIKTLRTLDAEERPATDGEKTALVKYVGWGAMPQVFDVDSTDWRKEQIQLSEILSDDEHRSARATTDRKSVV